MKAEIIFQMHYYTGQPFADYSNCLFKCVFETKRIEFQTLKFLLFD